MNSKELGKFGEDYAVKYLQREGYQVCCRNYKCLIGEIDIIAQKDQTLYFIEVKCRNHTAFGFPYEAVNKRKQHKIRKVAMNYLRSHTNGEQNYSFIVISILVNYKGHVVEVEMIEDGFDGESYQK